ncbi:hypothetical protein BdWA1_001405 [Babesia duncani]|uniref:Uncharacterized protein n=1 Tax=Babesia duncani TaxID=323732 RepID=A0AAD9PP55_9APIC|nr:hypothetical protein BdWA1_001405 [Babesia duncani]
MYNSIALIPDSQVILVLSRAESQDNAMGLFAELSLVIDNNRYSKRPKFIRNVEIWKNAIIQPNAQNSLERKKFGQTKLNIPDQLIRGNSLFSIFNGNGCVNAFDLYDLADSIMFGEAETLSQYHDDERFLETTRILQAR